MSYRITLNRPPVVECDTAEEVFALAALAMDRQDETRITNCEATATEENSVTAPSRPALTVNRLAAEPAEKGLRNVTSEICEYLNNAGCSKRPSQLAEALGVGVREVQSILSTHHFEAIGRGYYRLADAEPRKKTKPAPKPRAKLDPIAEAVEEFEDAEPPRRGRPPKAAPAQSQQSDLVERIRKVMALEGGTLQVMTIALKLDAHAGTVRRTLTENPDLFELTTNGGGYRLK